MRPQSSARHEGKASHCVFFPFPARTSQTDLWRRVQFGTLVRFGGPVAVERHAMRSEEHTSELQSPCNLVCRLLLEKKKITRPINQQEIFKERTQVCKAYPSFCLVTAN